MIDVEADDGVKQGFAFFPCKPMESSGSDP